MSAVARFTFYRLDTGELLQRRFSGSERILPANTPPGCGAVPGWFDGRARRVVNGQAEEWTPPAPADSPRWAHEWNAQAHAWERKPGMGALRVQARAALRRAIDAQEQMQPRVVREMLIRLANGANADGEAARLRTVEQIIEAVREDIRRLPGANRVQLLAMIKKYA